jgi:hypothetical protein
MHEIKWLWHGQQEISLAVNTCVICFNIKTHKNLPPENTYGFQCFLWTKPLQIIYTKLTFWKVRHTTDLNLHFTTRNCISNIITVIMSADPYFHPDSRK